MSVALPPPLPPQQDAVEQIRHQPSLGVLRHGDYRIHLLGPGPDRALSTDDLQERIDEADTLSNAVRAIAQAVYDAGYPGSRLRYALDDHDLYVAVDLGRLSSVEAPEVLQPYFADLPRGAPLTDRKLEPRRATAEVHAERAAIGAEMQVIGPADQQTLEVRAQPSDAPPLLFEVAFSNPGNRFAGRHFLDFDLNYVRPSGDAFGLLWSTSLTGLNEEGAADEYNDETLSWSRVTPHGLLSATARMLDYKQRVSGEALGNEDLDAVVIDGDLEELQLAWSYPLWATLAARWIADISLEYTRKRRSAPAAALTAQNQQYPSLEIGQQLSYSGVLLGVSWDLEGGLGVRKGLRDRRVDDGADFAYLLWQPEARADAVINERTTATLALAGQLTSDTLPEQAQWVLGGLNNVSAWLPGVAVGDSGAIAMLQLEHRLPSWRDVELRPRVFVEYGYSRYENPLPGDVQTSVRLADAGIEIYAQRRWLDASLAVAAPLLDDDLDAQTRSRADANLLFRIGVLF